ncbi:MULTISPECIES: ATP-binding protein [unclassified Acinetobacter]|uniref:ATP-binding protein n=1 Tax=unclassified Acinetobacter TaxID=196816 RepID=UPI0035B6C189
MDNLMELRQASVDLNGLMSVLSQHLYSTPMVAIRELVQNAHDSIVRRRMEQPDWQGTSRIDIIPDTTNNLIRIIDTGAGLTESEIHQYLATVGVGYTRKLREAQQNAQAIDDTGLIGMFGLGFLSAFVLAKKVTVSTTSYQQPDLGFCYTSSNAKNYTVHAIPAREVGTEILIELHDQYDNLTYPQNLNEILTHYCALLPEPIYIDGQEKAINPEPPPWRHQQDIHPSLARKNALAFAARFESNFEPICTVDIRPNADCKLQGILWIQDGATYGTSDNRHLSVFVRGMLLDDNARDLLPSWAGFIGGVIESNQLTPTASREDLQRDQYYQQAQYHLSEMLIQGLAEIAKTQPEAWRRVLRRHNQALLGAALCDDRLMTLLMDSLQIATSQGDILAKQLVHQGAMHVVLDSKAGFETMLFRALGIAVAEGNRYAVVPFLRRYASYKGLKLIELGTSSGNRQLFQRRVIAPELSQWLTEHLCENENLIVASFAPDSLPLVVVQDREQALKKRLDDDEKDKKISQAALQLARHFTAQIVDEQPAKLYLNIDNDAVKQLLQQIQHSPEQAKVAVRLLKAMKTILFSQQQQDDNTEQLQQALGDLNQSILALLK